MRVSRLADAALTKNIATLVMIANRDFYWTFKGDFDIMFFSQPS